MPGRWRKRKEEHRADKQQGDAHALDRKNDPRGGRPGRGVPNGGST